MPAVFGQTLYLFVSPVSWHLRWQKAAFFAFDIWLFFFGGGVGEILLKIYRLPFTCKGSIELFTIIKDRDVSVYLLEYFVAIWLSLYFDHERPYRHHCAVCEHIYLLRATVKVSFIFFPLTPTKFSAMLRTNNYFVFNRLDDGWHENINHYFRYHVASRDDNTGRCKSWR